LRERLDDAAAASRYTLGMPADTLTTVPPAALVPGADPRKPFWPARLPRELEVPANTLWFNLEVSAHRYTD
jgi:hypothetical protein